MALKWMTNMGIPILPESQQYLDDLARQGNAVVQSDPKATDAHTSEELKALGMIGIYVKESEVENGC